MSDGEKPEINPVKVNPNMRIKVLDDQELERIHQATLTVLNEAGVKFPSDEALKIFADAGADVDFESEIVKIPPDLLMDALQKAPRNYTLASRSDPTLDLQLDRTKTYLGTDGTGTATVDLETRKRRPSTKEDVAMGALISDYLSSISFYWPMVSAQDVPSPVIPLHEIEASFMNTEKHVQLVSCVEKDCARYAVEIATVVTGGSEELKKRPPLSLATAAISPLAQDKGALDAALIFAEKGLPVSFGTMPTMCATAPASMAGTLVVGNAEVLSALCLIQLAYPGAPVLYSFFPEMINPHTGGLASSVVQKPLLYSTGVQLGHYYDIPVKGYHGATDKKEPDKWQVGKEKSVEALQHYLVGPEIIPCIGLLEAYTLFYPEQMLLDCDIFETIKAFTNGIKVDSETLAIDDIIAVGPRGQYLTSEYTKRNLRKIWQPGITHQWSQEEGDFQDSQEAAIEKVKWILENHKPKPLEEKVEKEVKKIIKEAEGELL